MTVTNMLNDITIKTLNDMPVSTIATEENRINDELKYSLLEKMVEIPLYIDSYIKLLTDIDKLYDKLETDKLQIDTARQTLSIIKLIETSYVTIKSLRLEFKQTILQSEFLLDD